MGLGGLILVQGLEIESMKEERFSGIVGLVSNMW